MIRTMAARRFGSRRQAMRGMFPRTVRLIALAAAALATNPSVSIAAGPPAATTLQGKAQGKLINEGKVRAFLGLPYAAPPVGQLRWKAPEPPLVYGIFRNQGENLVRPELFAGCK